jgi:hypothetical protein
MSTETTSPTSESSDLTTPDAVVRALYASISFSPGGEPDWERVRSLFFQGARVIPPKRAGTDRVALDIEAFLERFRKNLPNLRPKGFREIGAATRLDVFGDVAHAFSTYACSYPSSEAEGASEPFSRGINSIQLVRDGGRWWVSSLAWDEERADNPLPRADG